MTLFALRFVKIAMLGLAAFALVACETPEERTVRINQHNGKSVAHVSALFGPPVKRTGTQAVWAMHNSFVVRYPIEDIINGRRVIVGFDNQVVNQYCELTAQLKRNIIVSSSVKGTGCHKMVPKTG